MVDPTVNAVLALDDTALDQAAASDRRRAAGTTRGPLDGVPVLVKDNIDTAGLATTAGSRHLAGTPPRRDAEIVRRLRSSGAVILGKTNLTEWANFRTSTGCEGWSTVGGQTRNPHNLQCTPWGSSSGSAVAVATGMAPLALGTETDGSIVCPAGVNGVVGVKPEPGPAPHRRHRPDLLARWTWRGAARAAFRGDGRAVGPQWIRSLSARPAALAGRRIGLWRVPGMPDDVYRLLDDIAGVLGADIVPVELEVGRDLLVPWFRAVLRRLPAQPGGVPAHQGRRTAHARRTDRREPRRRRRAGRVRAGRRPAPGEAGRVGRGPRRCRCMPPRTCSTGSSTATASTRCSRRRTGRRGASTRRCGDPGAPNSSSPAALAGYPNISLPAGFVDGLPIGVSVFGPSRLARLLPLAAAVERAVETR